MYIVGLTGGIASGKSHAAKYLVAKGAQTLNCDSLGHESYTKGSASYAKIVSTFGVDVLDANDEIDRRVLGPIVFSDPKTLVKHMAKNLTKNLVQTSGQQSGTKNKTYIGNVYFGSIS